MKVGFIGFGEVASNLSKWLKDEGVESYTSLENRSSKTKKLAEEYAANICPDNKTLAELSDILISAVTPAEAVNVAEEVGKYVKGIYVDLNNISPQTVRKALGNIENGKTVDAAIMGGIKKEGVKVQIIASGRCASQFAGLNKYGLNIKIVNHDPGKAKALKMLRSSYTKGVSALLLESLYSAYMMGLDKEFLENLERTECPGFKNSAISRVKSSAIHSQRKAQEMDEIINFMIEYGHIIMSKSTKEVFKDIYSKISHDKRYENYKELFESIK
ncbi:MAG: NAD(P)-binding domain-containing protein [Methanobacterium sp.]|nr:NAD(P)-binding domain-containing protein [Methanobacterium sp.]